MPSDGSLTRKERKEIEALIDSFDDHGCGIGLNIKAQAALRRLLGALDGAERTVEEHRDMLARGDGGERSGGPEARGRRGR